MTRLVLASGSPRRRALLTTAGAPPDLVRPPAVDEHVAVGERPARLVRRLARTKVVAARRDGRPGDVLLAADTVVDLGGRVLGKPVDEDDAAAMLAAVAGRTVAVWSGVAVAAVAPTGTVTGPPVDVVVATLLRMRPTTLATIAAYVATGEPVDAAGAFRIQGLGAALVAARHGCWTNVVGLPVCESARLLRPHGIRLHVDRSGDACRGPGPPG